MISKNILIKSNNTKKKAFSKIGLKKKKKKVKYQTLISTIHQKSEC